MIDLDPITHTSPQHTTPRQSASCGAWTYALCIAALALCTTWTTPAYTQPSPPPAPSPQEHTPTTGSPAEEGIDWFVLPALKYNDDAGFAYGLRAALVKVKPDMKPHDWRLYLKLDHSTRNRHDHGVLFDTLNIFDTKLRLITYALYRTIDDAIYAGSGNNTPQPDPTRDIYAVKLPQARFMLQSFLGDTKWLIGGGLSTTYVSISNIPQDSALARENPLGLNGGFDISPLAFLGFDSRNSEIAPTHGTFLELYTMGTTTAFASTFNTLTVGAQVAHFLPLTPKLVLAQRILFEDLSGEVPFYERVRMGGRFRVRGIGGSFTQRGFVEGRFAGNTKAISNHELRYTFPPLFKGLYLGVAPFADFSHVFDNTDTLSGFFDNINASGGGEFSVRWRDSFAIRFDYAISREDRLIYIQAQHMF